MASPWLVPQTGFPPRGFLVLGDQGPDAGGNQTYDLTVPNGIALLINPTENGYQLDAAGGSVDPQVESPGLRLAVVSAQVDNVGALFSRLLGWSQTVGSFFNDPLGATPTLKGRFIPDLNFPLLQINGAGGVAGGTGLQIEYDEVLRAPGAATLVSKAEQVIFSARPGGGLVIGPKRAVAVLIVALRSQTGGVIVAGTKKTGATLSGWARGGPLAPGQFLQASDFSQATQVATLGAGLSRDTSRIGG